MPPHHSSSQTSLYKPHFPFIFLPASHRLPPYRYHRLSFNHKKMNKNLKMESTTTTTRRPYFIEENNGLASIYDLENGFSSLSPSSSTEDNHRAGNHLISRPLYSPRKTSLRNLSSFSSVSSPRSGKFFNGRFEEQQPYFLDACFLCKKPLGLNRDIFMYRGDTPFCSEECRAEQIDMDESKQKNKNLSASMRALRKKEQSETASNKSSSKKYPFDSGAVAAA